MRSNCPNSSCNNHNQNDFVVSDGFYFRKDDSKNIQRFKCKICGKKFSSETRKLEYRQKKRRVNFTLFGILSSGVSQRRSAKLCRINRLTVSRKLIYLAEKSRRENQEFLKKLEQSKVQHLQFDDLITYEHTKLKPLSVSVAVDATRRYILGFEIAMIPSFGHLARISKHKYGKRKNEHREKLNDLFSKISSVVDPFAIIKSDEHKEYKPIIEIFFPQSTFMQYKGEKATIAGLGELKKNGRDPLFWINHTLAMFRANINRLFRRTWCSTKSIKSFSDHLEIFICFYNQHYLTKK